jgi:two-component system sensor histidine kinase SenX3
LTIVETLVLIAGGVCLVAGVVAMFVARRQVNEAETASGAAARHAGARVEAADLAVARLAEGLHAVPDAIVIVDRDGNEVFRNQAAIRFADARHADAVAAQLVDTLLARALAGQTCTRELPLFGPPREVLLITARPITSEGATVGATALVEDVTDLRRVESVRRDFVANVSHELKTPIGALTLLAETIAAADDPEAARGLFDQMVREADRLARIVDDLLDLSLIEAQEAPTRERVPLRVLLDEAVERVRALALAKGIPLVYEPPADELAISCDPLQLVGAFTNLLDNAVKYSDEHGSVEVGTTVDGERVCVWVRDRGIGIPSRDLERIFERFYRVDRARSRATGGTGLGLSIVRHVAQVHGGDVVVESVEGEGSTFKLALPISGAADIEVPERAEAS